MKKWIWEQEGYPNFTYNLKEIEPLLQKVSQAQGYLIAIMEFMNEDHLLNRQIEALENEAINTSLIEGEVLNRDSVKSSIKRKLGFKNIDYKKNDENINYLIEVLIDANTNYKDDLTQERLFGWHNALFPRGFSGFIKINVATLRDEGTMEIVSGKPNFEKTYYVAPPKEILEDELNRFLTWFNKEEASLIKAAITHLWFVIIHPFDDGNGRITRALTDLVLSKIEQSSISKLYSMSSAINANKDEYYKTLENTTGYVERENPLDITLWIRWFLETLHIALRDTKKKLEYISFANSRNKCNFLKIA